jgi:tagatose 6-phosphate kinase
VILAAGLTPAWQHVLVFDGLRMGEVNRARESRWFASGKAVNVALAVQSLGAEGTLISLIGGASGAALAEDFEATGATAEWVTSGVSTRLCTTLIEAGAAQTTELVENSPAVTHQELARYSKTFAGKAGNADVIVLSGSLPTDTPRSFYRDLLTSAAGSPAPAIDGGTARLVFDFRGPELLECLSFRPFLVKPNREELASTVGRALDDDAAVLKAMRELNRGGARWVLVTNGGEPAWLTSEDEMWQVRPPGDVQLVNPIGCGDSVAAGIAVGLAEQKSVQECVSLGFGAAAANLERMECARFESRRARELATRAVWQRIERAMA